ncbi:anoctamin-6-like [Convolutriloba macropyga]|uniref:anoctamin-6-like n=1 Tax=Convolutriloba macropyga TaxID=536237 RepID=UPI003F5229D5
MESHELTYLEFVSSRTQWNVSEGVSFTVEQDPLAVATNNICRYPDMRYPNAHPEELVHTSAYWHLVAIKLGFLFLFVNVVAAVAIAVRLIVPDEASRVRVKRLREQFVANEKLNPSTNIAPGLDEAPTVLSATTANE